MLKKYAGEQLTVSVGQYSCAGNKPLNQDFHGVMIPEGSALALKGVALAISDGISSSNVSHIAAETAVKSFLTDYYCTSDAWSVKTAGYRVLWATNAWLYSQSRSNRLADDMNRGYVATFSAIVLKGRAAHLFHVGDSRVFRIVSGSLEQLTSDHRTVLSSTESYLGRALGLSDNVDVDYRALDVRPGDTFVMTTDGVHEHITKHSISKTIAGASDLDAAAKAIVDEALANGSDDNLTIQIVRVDQAPDRDAMGIIRSVDLLPPAPVPNVPSEYDGYRIVRQLHASSRSHLFVAIDLETGKKVAFKVPSIDLRENIDYLRRFAMEEWIARRLSSLHVMKAAPAHKERDTLYAVSELIEGQTLRQWMVDNPAPDIETVRGIVEQIEKGLRAFHRMEMLHQDLRPENIMINREGTVKIIDFGSVSVAGVLESSPDLDTGDILGTHQYAAPEYFLGYAGSNRSDLYSLGVITYEMLTGQLPYGARMARATSKAGQLRTAYTPLAAFRNDLPTWIDAALKKAVHPDPFNRQDALSEFTHDLREPRIGHLTSGRAPVIERNPVLFWKLMSLGLALALAGLAVWR